MAPDSEMTITSRHLEWVISRIGSVPMDSASCDYSLHGVTLEMVIISRAQLPIRLARCRLRDSDLTAPAAYWASWADILPGVISRYPQIGQAMLLQLSVLQSLDGDQEHDGPHCIRAAGNGMGRPPFVERHRLLDS